jgi:hypothetical protein
MSKSRWGAVKGLFVVTEEAKDDATPAPAGESEDVSALLAQLEGRRKPGAAPAAEAPVEAVDTTADTTIVSREFTNIYATALVPASPYAAEKLLKVLDGLKAMDEPTRRTVVATLDSADDAWTIEDPVLDAQRKMDALRGERERLTSTLANAEAQAVDAHKTHDAYLATTSSEIKAQIEELQALLQSEITEVTNKKAGVDANIASVRASCARETKRLTDEENRLAVVPKLFGTSPVTNTN